MVCRLNSAQRTLEFDRNPTAKCEVVVKCINLSAEPHKLKVGTIIVINHSIKKDKIGETSVRAYSALSALPKA